MLTKEQAAEVFSFLKLHQEFSEINKNMMAELTSMLDELDIKVKGVISINIDGKENKVVITYVTEVKGIPKKLDIYAHEGYDIYYNPASWEIAKREIKDIFFDVRKNMREKAGTKPLTFWQKIKKWFSELGTFD